MAEVISEQAKGGAKAFFFTYIMPALGTTLVAGAVSFGASYLSVREQLTDVRREVTTLQRESADLKAAEEKLATKEAEAIKDAAILQTLQQMDKRMNRLEEKSDRILERLPASR